MTSTRRGEATAAIEDGRIRVAVRVRPPLTSEVTTLPFRGAVRVASNPATHIQSIHLLLEDYVREFTFDRCFGPAATQERVFVSLGRPLVADVLSGLNGALLVYGQTSAGKTFTLGLLQRMTASSDGVVPRALVDIFSHISRCPGPEWSVSISFMQLYLETVQDLLSPSSTNLAVREAPDRGFFVEGLTERHVKSLEEAMSVINNGLESRVMASTAVNATSSRSHVILTITVRQTVTAAAGHLPYARTLTGKLTLVDLAGSERVKKTKSRGVRLDEARFINSSLSALGNVVSALSRDRDSRHVPFRDSKLTRLLQGCLGGGSSNTSLLACLSPAREHSGETQSTLAFAQRCMDVETRVVVNDSTAMPADATQLLERQVSVIKAHYEAREAAIHAQYESKASPQRPPLPADHAEQLVRRSYKALYSIYLASVQPLESDTARELKQREGWMNQKAVASTRRALFSLDGSIEHALREFDLPDIDSEKLESAVSKARLDVHQRHPSATAGGSSPVVVPDLELGPPLDNIPAFEKQMQALEDALSTHFERLGHLLELKDLHYERIKEELMNAASERQTRDEELVSWAFVLRQLLQANARLRDQLATAASQPRESRPPPRRAEWAADPHAVQERVASWRVMRLESAVKRIQRAFRSRRRQHVQKKQVGPDAVRSPDGGVIWGGGRWRTESAQRASAARLSQKKPLTLREQMETMSKTKAPRKETQDQWRSLAVEMEKLTVGADDGWSELKPAGSSFERVEREAEMMAAAEGGELQRTVSIQDGAQERHQKKLAEQMQTLEKMRKDLESEGSSEYWSGKEDAEEKEGWSSSDGSYDQLDEWEGR